MLTSDLLEQFYTGIAAGNSARALHTLMRDTVVNLVSSRQVSKDAMYASLDELPRRGLESDQPLLAGIARDAVLAIDALSFPVRLDPGSAETRTTTAGSPPLPDTIQPLVNALTGWGMADPELRALTLVMQQHADDALFLRSIHSLIDNAGPFPGAC